MWAALLVGAGAIALADRPLPEVQVSDQLLRLNDACVIDLGVGVVEATGLSTLVEPSPSIRAAAEARTRAIEALRAAIPPLPVSDDRTYADLAGERLGSIVESAGSAPVVAEWRLEDGRIAAVARSPLFEGEGALLPAALGVTAEDEAGDAPPLPALVVVLRESALKLAPLPALRDAQAAELFADPEAALARGERPVRYAADRESALRMLADGQDALVVDGTVAEGDEADITLGPESLTAIGRAHLKPDYASFGSVIVVGAGR